MADFFFLHLRGGVSEVSFLLGCDAASLNYHRQTFRKKVLVLSSNVGMPDRKDIKTWLSLAMKPSRCIEKMGTVQSQTI